MSPAKGQKKERCVRGHDKRAVGTRPNGWCNECYRESYARRGLNPGAVAGPVAFRKPFCPRGHDKRVVGVTSRYACKACLRERNDAAYWREWRRRKGSLRAGLPEGAALPALVELPNLRALRLRAGLGQHEMARAIGLHPGHYGKLETGRKRAMRETAAAVMRALAGKGVRPIGRGRYRRLLSAMVEAERRGDPRTATVAAILGEEPVRVGSLLRWAGELGFAERFESGVWLATDEGRALAEGTAA